MRDTCKIFKRALDDSHILDAQPVARIIGANDHIPNFLHGFKFAGGTNIKFFFVRC